MKITFQFRLIQLLVWLLKIESTSIPDFRNEFRIDLISIQQTNNECGMEWIIITVIVNVTSSATNSNDEVA